MDGSLITGKLGIMPKIFIHRRMFSRWLYTCVVATSCSSPLHHEASPSDSSQLAMIASYSSFLTTTTGDERQKLLNFALALPVGEAASLMLETSQSGTSLGSLLAGTALVGSPTTGLGEALSAIGIKYPKLLTQTEFSAAVQAHPAESHATSFPPLSSPLPPQQGNGLSLVGVAQKLLDYSDSLCGDLEQQYVTQSSGKDISTLVQKIASYVDSKGSLLRIKDVLSYGANRQSERYSGVRGQRPYIFSSQEVRSYYCYCLGKPVPGDDTYPFYPPECSGGSDASDASASDQVGSTVSCSSGSTTSCSSATSAQLDELDEPPLVDTTGYTGGVQSASYIITHGSTSNQ